jgi:modulator of FtsH protease HflK
LRNEAEAYANDRLPRARGEAARNLAEATAYRDQTIARAQGDAARYLALYEEYRKAPKITRSRMYYDVMGEVYGASSKILIDVDKSNPTFFLPLDQLLKNAQRAGDAVVDSSTGKTYRTGPAKDGGDEAARSRDRSR